MSDTAKSKKLLTRYSIASPPYIAIFFFVEHADSYHVTIYTIEKDGRLTQRGKELTCSTTSITTREILYSKPGDYIFKVEAASDQTYLYTSKKAELAYNHSKYLSSEDIGYYTGYWQKKNGSQLYKLASTERA